MNKMFVEDIIDFQKKNKNYPAPNSYIEKKTFSKDGAQYSMRAKMIRYGEKDENFSPSYLDRQKKLPGPGYYAHPETVGSKNIASQFYSH
jgi:hypothetical protein